LAILSKERVITGTVVPTIHKRCILPLVQRVLFLYQMKPQASLFGMEMLEEPVPASEIT
jgi:hypothetical protein